MSLVSKQQIILGVESSCDETAVAVLEGSRNVLSSQVASQAKVHARFGGVVPEIAAREHLTAIDALTQRALAEAGLRLSDLDAVAVTQGPGLIGALLVGISYAKGLSTALGLPLIPVDHVNAHIHGTFLGSNALVPYGDMFPSLVMVVSGGHSNLYYMKHADSFKLLATTIDDACGECFDKVGKILGLSYPAGAAIEKLAAEGDPKAFEMPRMVARKDRLEFSYSGLKTHMLYRVRKLTEPCEGQLLRDLCASFQEEALHQLVRKLLLCKDRYPDAASVIISGGVAINGRLRSMVREQVGLPVFYPDPKYCGDNAAMIAAYGAYKLQQDPKVVNQKRTWDAYSRYCFEDFQ